MVTFVPGELFDSFADVQQKLFDYSEQNYCHFYIKDSKKLLPEETDNPYLIYKHVSFSCIYGGQKARFRGTGNRSVTSIRHGCSACLYIRCTRDRTRLQVRTFIDEHNHEVSEELYRSAAQDKKLPWDLRQEVEELLLIGADKDRLIEYIRETSGKVLDKKHLFNIHESALRQQREITRDRAVMLIQKVYATDSAEEADSILTSLLENPRKSRRSGMQEQTDDSVQYTFINETDGEETTVDGEMGEELQRLVGSLQGTEGERIVIVQGDDQYEVIEADPMEEAEYLEEDSKEQNEIIVKQENLRDEDSIISNSPARRVAYRNFAPKRTLMPKMRPTYQETHKKMRPMAMPMPSRSVQDHTENNAELEELRMSVLQAEKSKLQGEIEMLKLKRNKLVRDISKVDLEKSKLYLEIDLYKMQKKFLAEDMQTKELKNEKLRLEIAKLKGDSN